MHRAPNPPLLSWSRDGRRCELFPGVWDWPTLRRETLSLRLAVVVLLSSPLLLGSVVHLLLRNSVVHLLLWSIVVHLLLLGRVVHLLLWILVIHRRLCARSELGLLRRIVHGLLLRGDLIGRCDGYWVSVLATVIRGRIGRLVGVVLFNPLRLCRQPLLGLKGVLCGHWRFALGVKWDHSKPALCFLKGL